jgi:hypothetical protein
MNNVLVLKTVSILSFIISAIFTILLMTSNTIGILSFVLTVGMAVILELAKCGFFFEALTNNIIKMPVRILLGAIAILLIFASIFASAAYIQNQTNKAKNVQLQNSESYKQVEQNKKINVELYEIKKKEIEDLKNQINFERNETNKIIESMPANYIDRKNQARIQSQNKIADIQKNIDGKTKELYTLAEKIQITQKIDQNKNILNENGYTSMFENFANILNKNSATQEQKITTETLELWFYVMLGIIFEFVAVLTSYLALQKSNKLATKTQNDVVGFKPTLIKTNEDTKEFDFIKPKMTIGFKQENKSQNKLENLQTPNFYNNEDIKKYITYMYTNLKNGNESKGYNPIGKNTGIGVEVARKIKAHLEQIGVIQTIGTKTFVLDDYQACTQKIQA